MDDYDDDFEGEGHNGSNKQTISNQEYSQQFDTLSHHEVNKSPPHNATRKHNDNRRQLIEENEQRRKIAYELATQVDELKERRRRQQNRARTTEQSEEEGVISLQAVLGKQQVEITSLKTQIYALQKKVEQSYDSTMSRERREEREKWEKELRGLREERQFLGRIKRDQRKALKAIRNDKEHEERVRELKEECASLRDECRALTEEINSSEKQQRRQHQLLRKRQSRLKEYESAMREDGKGWQGGGEQVTAEMLGELDEKIGAAERERRQNEKAYSEKQEMIEMQLGQKRGEEERKLLIYKQKERESKINDIKIKQLRKLIQHHSNLLRHPPKEEVDLKQFRHRRNIRQMNQ